MKGMQKPERSTAVGFAKKRYFQDGRVLLTEPQDHARQTNQVEKRIGNDVSPNSVSVVRRKGGNHLLTRK